MRWRPKALKVAILGCGPTGLFAAHAFATLGYSDVTVFSRKRRSEMFGAQYLHQPIPSLTEGEGQSVSYRLRGTPEQYARKVYGSGMDPSRTSPVILHQDHQAWDIRSAYYRAWDLYASRIVNVKIDPSGMTDFIRQFDFVVSTVPATELCNQTCGDIHRFQTQKVWAVGDAPERGIFCPITVPPWTVECNGEETPRWYRASNVFGYKTAEWPGEKAPPVESIAAIEKPIGTNCDCWLGKNFMRAGRYGTWTKGVLSHQVYYDIVGSF